MSQDDKKSVGSTSTKKIAVYAVLGIVAVAAVALWAFTKPPPSKDVQDSGQNATLIHRATFCGDSSLPNSDSYVQEFRLPSSCEMPLAVYAQGDTIWYISTENGILGSYNSKQGKYGEEFQIPMWNSRASSIANPQMSWEIMPDSKGGIWFITEANELWKFDTSTQQFLQFKTPSIYPESFVFDASGNIYMSGFFGKSLWYADISKLKNGTSDGFSEIKLPLDQFNGTQVPVGSGSLSIDLKRNAVWLPLLSFEEKGVIIRYDIGTKKITSYPLSTLPPAPLLSPSSTSLDNAGNLWVADHATSMFFKLDHMTGNVTKYATSVASPRLYGGKSLPNAVTLPYWIKIDPNGILWFNEHTGNKIARFDPVNETLVEYWIPSQNPYWANCSGNSSSCGIANALQFSPSQIGSVWFTEWTENKIGRVDSIKAIPASVSITADSYQVKKGQSIDINVDVSSNNGFNGKMISSGTLSSTGDLANATGTFSEDSITLAPGVHKQVSFIFTPSSDLQAGDYTLMIGAEDDQVSILKAVHVAVS